MKKLYLLGAGCISITCLSIAWTVFGLEPLSSWRQSPMCACRVQQVSALSSCLLSEPLWAEETPEWYLQYPPISQAPLLTTWSVRSLAVDGVSYSAGLARLDPDHLPLCSKDKPCVLFVKTDDLLWFFRVIFPKLGPFVLLVGGSDYCVPTAEMLPYLKDDRLIAWLSTNVVGKYPKMKPIPLGFSRTVNKTDVLLRGNFIKQRDAYFGESTHRHVLLSGRFKVGTNVEERGRALQACLQVKKMYPDRVVCALMPDLPRNKMWNEMQSTRFIQCPTGNGVDTMRIWEALWMGAYPVVSETSLLLGENGLFEGLPVIQLRRWETMTKEVLEKKAAAFPKITIEEVHQRISIEYVNKLIDQYLNI